MKNKIQGNHKQIDIQVPIDNWNKGMETYVFYNKILDVYYYETDRENWKGLNSIYYIFTINEKNIDNFEELIVSHKEMIKHNIEL